MERFDVAVIGGGLLGCFAARNLCRWDASILLLEAREDVCTGISRANSAIIYPGYDHKPGTLKASMTVRGNEAFGRLCQELDVPFSRCGSLMLSYGPKADAVLRSKYEERRRHLIAEENHNRRCRKRSRKHLPLSAGIPKTHSKRRCDCKRDAKQNRGSLK